MQLIKGVLSGVMIYLVGHLIIFIIFDLTPLEPIGVLTSFIVVTLLTVIALISGYTSYLIYGKKNSSASIISAIFIGVISLITIFGDDVNLIHLAIILIICPIMSFASRIITFISRLYGTVFKQNKT